VADKKKHLTKGTSLVAPPTDVLIFDCSSLDLSLGDAPPQQ
jgi:hypothetical protein